MERLKKEKSEIEAEFEEFKKALERKDKGRKESHKLRNFINNMEKDLMNEVLRHRSSVGKKLLENKTLTAEVESNDDDDIKYFFLDPVRSCALD